MSNINIAINKYKKWYEIHKNCNCIPFDYEHDANLYMALFEEMVLDGDISISEVGSFSSVTGRHLKFEIIYDPYNKQQISAEADTIGIAICLAYCHLNVLECEG